MKIDAIASAYLAVADLDTACRPYERLGLRLSPAAAGRRTLHAGGAGNLFSVHFGGATGRDDPLAGSVQRALAAGRPLFAVGLRVANLAAAVRDLASKGVEATTFHDGGEDLAWLPLHARAGTDIVLTQARRVAASLRGLPDHDFPLLRLDHLAAVTPDLEARTRFWADVLGVLVASEVTTPTMVIRQLRIADAVLELLGPASQDSPIRKRPPGLVGMASWQVADLDAAVEQARAAGFTVAEPAAGPLPGTRIATVPGAELAGVNLQLLQYV